jgi:sulfur-carrier protein
MRVDFYATLRDIVNGKSVEFDLEHGVTARELLDAIVTRYPAMKKELLNPDGRLYGHVHFFVNGRDIQFLEDDLETKIMPGDVVKVFPAVGGG